jgi:vacuolar-type H+-ATPase subunit C/Vma6
MDLTSYNIDNGYTEAILRGYRLNFLKEEDYVKIKGFTTLQDLWNFLQTEKGFPEMDGMTVTIQAIKNQLKQKLANEIGNHFFFS